MPDGADARELWRDRIAILLQGREEHLGRPDPTLWRSGDVHRLLIDHVAPRQVDAWGLAEHAIDTLAQFLRFLDDSGRLHPGSTRAATLLKELGRAESKFGEAMADTSRFRLAKRVWTAMRADGVSPDSDPAEIDRWAERFSARDAAGRREVLGELMDRDPGYAIGHLLVHDGQVAILQPHMPADKRLVWPDEVPCDCGCADAADLPDPRLPPEPELATAVADSEVLRRLCLLADWVGEGRAVDRHGELLRKDLVAAAGAADVPAPGGTYVGERPALDILWVLALELGVLSLRRTRVVAGERLPGAQAALHGAGAPGTAVELWDDVYDELVHPAADPSAPEQSAPEQKALRDWAQPWTPHLLGTLYTGHPSGEFVEVMPLMDTVIAERADDIPSAEHDTFVALAGTTVLGVLSRLADHGAVEVVVPAGPVPMPAKASAAAAAAGMPSWVVAPPERLQVRLTGLARRAVHRRLAGEHR